MGVRLLQRLLLCTTPETMQQPLIRILIVEDNPSDVRLIKDLLDGVDAYRFELTRAVRLAEAIRCRDKTEHDLIVLDLNLPDSSGLDTLRAICSDPFHMPIIVLTGAHDEDTGQDAVRLGAQDYLVKDDLTEQTLKRSILYTLARHELAMQYRHRLEQELRGFERASETGALPVASATYSAVPLRDAAPEAFSKLARKYAKALDAALERRLFKRHADLSTKLREFAEDLGALRASSRDVADMHIFVLEAALRETLPQRSQAYLEEGRFVAFELLGHLANVYRRMLLNNGHAGPGATQRAGATLAEHESD